MGQWSELAHGPRHDGGGGRMGRGMMGGGGYVLPNGAEFPVCKVKVNRREKATLTLFWSKLRALPPESISTALESFLFPAFPS